MVVYNSCNELCFLELIQSTRLRAVAQQHLLNPSSLKVESTRVTLVSEWQLRLISLPTICLSIITLDQQRVLHNRKFSRGLAILMSEIVLYA